MNRKQLIVILVLVAVLGGAGLITMNRNQPAASSGGKLGQKVLEKFQLNDVAQIHLIGDSELNLVKKDDLWRVQERGSYPANYTQIVNFLLKLADLKVAQSEEVDPSQLPGLQLLEPTKGSTNSKAASVIELMDKNGKVMQALLLGIKHTRKMASPYGGGEQEYPDGRYILVRGDSKNVLLISDPLGTSDPKPDQWVKKDFFKVEKIKSVSFVSTNATNSWALVSTNETGPLTLANAATNEVIDAGKISSISSTLGNPSFVDIATVVTPDKTGLDKPQTLNIETSTGFSYAIKIGNKTPENNYYVTVSANATLPKERTPGKDEKPEAKAKLDKEFADKAKLQEAKLAQEKSLEKWTYLVAGWTIDPLIRGRAQLLQDKKDDKAKGTDKESNDDAPSVPTMDTGNLNMTPVPDLSTPYLPRAPAQTGALSL